MTAVPVVRTFVSGEVVVAAYFNTNINGPVGFLLAPPILEVEQTANQTLTTATATSITFTSEVVDSSGMHSTSSNTSRATAVYPGWYDWGAAVGWTANATGVRAAWWAVNGATINRATATIGANAAIVVTVARRKLIFLNVNDYVEIAGYQTSGGNLATTNNAPDMSSMTGRWTSN